ncbi:sulfotransferase family protein [Aliagarivorans marinus]|uniref:sulfotransferase family protein n=1 Tax=Aliagarivorans marinus TaxID=561965 RepID=UPI00040E206A|nr:sulfotransferase family protein [Aliagarivorans marinus]
MHITKSAGTSVALSLFGKLPYHYRAWEYRVIFGRRRFNQYFKFAFVRNPWDRLYSAYSYLKGGGWNDDDRAWSQQHLTDIDDFEQFVLEWLTPERLYAHIHFWPQSDFIYDEKGKLLIDYVGYFEDINTDFKQIAKQLGIHTDLSHTNKSQRQGYQDVYTPEAIAKVAKLYQQDIQRFGYEFASHRRQQVINGTLRNEQ